jgi:hypothetical protein
MLDRKKVTVDGEDVLHELKLIRSWFAQGNIHGVYRQLDDLIKTFEDLCRGPSTTQPFSETAEPGGIQVE